MKKLCWLLIFVLVIGCFVGCQQAPAAQRSIENEDGTLADWMKEEITNTCRSGSELYWWDPQNPLANYVEAYYYGTYNGYVMYYIDGHYAALKRETIAGYEFVFPSEGTFIMAYKDGEIYELGKLFNEGLIDEEAIRIAHEHYTEINKIKDEHKKQQS